LVLFVRYIFTALLLLLIAGTTPTFGQSAERTPAIPNYWDSQERFIKPDMSGTKRLRFLTIVDFQPFSYLDSNARLAGFHVALARAICAELDLTPVCQIQGLPFEELEKALMEKKGEALLAGIAVTPETRARLGFTRSYFRLPARFITLKGTRIVEPVARSLTDRAIGVVAGSSHEAFAKKFFGKALIRIFLDRKSAYEALKKDRIIAVFSDALSLSAWLQTKDAQVCCEFSGGPYFRSAYFGRGLAIAVRPEDEELVNALNFALRSISDKGIFAELYLQYFPVGLH